MSYLMNLPPELREEIFNNCYTSDLKNLACCSSVYYATLKPILWRTVEIGCRPMLDLDWDNLADKTKVANFKFTQTLRLFKSPAKEPEDAVQYEDDDEYKTVKMTLISNINIIFQHCCPSTLRTFYIDHFIVLGILHEPYIHQECLQEISKTFTGLKSLSIKSLSFTDDMLEAVCKLHYLQDLEIPSWGIHDRHLTVFCESLLNLKQLDLTSSCITDNGLCHIVKLKKLKTLILGWCGITDLGLSYIGRTVTLRKLSLYCCRNISDVGILSLNSLISLKELNLYYCKVSDFSIPTISTLGSLQHLVVRNSNITDEGLKVLTDKNKSLLKLDIGNCAYTFVTNAGISYISKLTFLKTLDISSTGLEDSGLSEIKNLVCLQVLNIGDTNITDAGLKQLIPLVLLVSLSLGKTFVTDEGMLHVCHLKKLRKLHLYECMQITNMALMYLCNTSLEYITIAGTDVTDVGFNIIASLDSLKVLVCGDTYITDYGVQALCSMKKLRQLEVNDCNGITDKALFHLESMESLDYLDVSRTNITDIGLRYLHSLRRLKYLECVGNNNVTKGELQKFSSKVEILNW